jgi:hypothetical protein
VDHISSFAAKDGTGAEGAIGEYSVTVADTRGKSNRFCSYETNHVGVSSQEDCGPSKSAVGEG